MASAAAVTVASAVDAAKDDITTDAPCCHVLTETFPLSSCNGRCDAPDDYEATSHAKSKAVKILA